MKRYIYSNRKEIEMKNANQININEMNNIYQKEIKITRMKEKIITPHDKRQDSFIIKKESNIAFVEIIHKKPRINKNLKEAKSKRKNDTLNDTFIIKDILPKSNNENENINNKNSINNNNNIIEKISNNKLNNTIIIDSKTDIKINVEKKEKEKEDKKDIKKEKDDKNEKEEKKGIKNEEKKEDKNDNIIKKEKTFTHIRLNTSIDKNKPQKIDCDDKMASFNTFTYNSNKNNKSERKNSSIATNEDKTLPKKKSNYSFYISDSVDKDKKYKKFCKLKKGNHLMNESSSNKKLNYSFKSINLSHSKPKKIKSITSITSHLFNYFSSESKQKIDFLKLREEKEKKIYHNNKIFERIMLKTKNTKTIYMQKNNLNLRATLIKNEKEKIIENENEDEKDIKKNEKKNINNTSNKKVNISNSQNKIIKITTLKKPPDKKPTLAKSFNKKTNKSNSPIKENNISNNSKTKNNTKKISNINNIEINIRIKKDQAKETKIYENGKYEGIIINGKREKQGVMEYNDGSKYEGEWNNDKKYGKGIFTKNIANNNINLTLIKYIGDFVNDKKEGNGTALYSNGDKYEGEWKNNKQYGKGIVMYSTGGRYEGEWADGKFNGLGIYYLRNGEKYEGKFKDNRYNGYGKFYHLNGDILEGIFINDQPNGECFLHKPDGTIETHNF